MIACLINDDATFRSVDEAFRQGGWLCTRHHREQTLLRDLFRTRTQIALVEDDFRLDVDDAILPSLRLQSLERAPLIVLSRWPTPERVAEVLDAGADDYVCSADPLILSARVRAVLRRARPRPASAPSIEMAGFRLQRTSGEVSDRGRPIDLTPSEFTLAWLFFSNPRTNLLRRDISAELWGARADDLSDRTIEQKVSTLRRKLGLQLQRGVTIRSTYARGYRMVIATSTATVAAPAIASQVPAAARCALSIESRHE